MLEENEEETMSEKSKVAMGYDPIEEVELAEDPMSAAHNPLPGSDDDRSVVPESPELRERMERARERIRRRNAERNRPYKESAT